MGFLNRPHLACLLLPTLAAASFASAPPPSLTPAVAGPYHVEGARLIDSHGRPYRIKGTSLAPVTSSRSDLAGAPGEFGPLSATTIVTIRQRLNMNAVRLPVNPVLYSKDRAFRERTRTVVETANHLELLVILEANAGSTPFWKAIATDFRGNPNVFFALPPQLPDTAAQFALDTIRATGARQPVIVGAQNLKDPNIIVQFTPHYATDAGELDRFASLAERVPVLADGMDPELFTDSPECRAFPTDPAAAASLVERRLTFLDSHGISWTLSAFQPGKLIADYRFLIGTRLENGWTCGRQQRDLSAGLGITVLAHLWNTSPSGLFPVNCMLGGFVVARGAVVSTYGPTLADRLEIPTPGTYPLKLGGVSIRVTDSHGVGRLAPLLYSGGGWAIVSFMVPADSALGPAEVTIVRDDGSKTKGRIVVTDIAPGIWTGNQESRGEANARVTQHFADGATSVFDATACDKVGCRSVPIPLSASSQTTLRLLGTGFRYVRKDADIRVSIGGRNGKVLSFGPDSTTPFDDQLTIEIPAELKGAGNVDLWFTVDGVLSNVVRLNLGKA